MFHVPEKFRVKKGAIGSDSSYGNNGAFIVKSLKLKQPLTCIAGDGAGWEHVSVSLLNRCPTWNEMAFIKNLFWDEDDLVIQYHPVKADYVNIHPFCLHLWRKSSTNDFVEKPPAWMVGYTTNVTGKTND